MLCKRVIAAVLIADGNVVQTRQFRVTNVVGKVETAVKFFAAWDADEIMLIDISKTPWPGMLKTVEAVTQNVFVPVTVGGHIRTLQQVRDVFNAGGDKVLVRRAAYGDISFVSEVSIKCGSQAICAGLDYSRDTSEETAFDKFRKIVHILGTLGAGELLINNRTLDGTKLGIDFVATKYATKSTNIPVISMGGCGTPEHAVEAIQAGADAVAIGNMLHYSEHAVVKAKRAIKAAGFPVRESNLAVL